MKEEAAKLGATAVLLSVDEFAMSPTDSFTMTPVNNVVMEGTAYK